MYKEVITLGVMPTKRPTFSLETATKEKDALMPIFRAQMPEFVKLVDCDDILAENNGMGAFPEDIDKVVAKFKANNVDALFFPFCDFGCEEVVVGVAKQFKLPVLVWGSRDKVSTWEHREKETQCGLFAATKVLRNYGVTFSYISNCEKDSPVFVEGFEKFIRVASVLKSLRNLVVAEIGDRPPQFFSVIHNQLNLIRDFGITVKPIAIALVKERTEQILSEKGKALTDYYAEYTARIDCSRTEDEVVWKLLAFEMAVEQLMDEHGARCAALDCPGLRNVLGLKSICAMQGELTDHGYPTSCETDVWGAIGQLMCTAATLGTEAEFLADWTYRHPDNDNAELIWHGGPFAYSLATKERKPRLIDGVSAWEMKQGDLTLMRMDEIDGEYFMFCGEGKTTTGPETTGTYVWLEVDNWKRWEEKLMFGPYIHHVAGVYGKYLPIFREVARYLNVNFDTVDDKGPYSL
ncbi:L-fucose/L-arabinose isomerase family protein [Luoshenia tenuis]|jgi:L-fucose isomerase-like protein|uniref:L-fucose/L-arabinose isomerase family protein n=1 Tax=Luoshenia tenuis TaxID=2763654 RepID=UPI003D8F974E